jgi:preprotein translocase subunit SecE
VARDRKRAKQRRERRGTKAARPGSGAGAAPAQPVLGAGEDAQAVSPSQPLRADLPGALDHASGEVDEFDAALVRGAGGVPATPEAGPQAGAEDALQSQEPSAGRGGGGADDGGDAGAGGGDRERPSGAPLRGGNRAVAFLRASWAELQRVQWPDRRQVTQATAVVLGFVAIAGVYLGVADFVAKEIVEAFL